MVRLVGALGGLFFSISGGSADVIPCRSFYLEYFLAILPFTDANITPN